MNYKTVGLLHLGVGSGGGGVSHLLRKEVTQSTAIVKYFVDGGIAKLPEHFILVSLQH